MRHDVAIVGAGPSGSWTATLLARRGARVLLDRSLPSSREAVRRRHHRTRADARRRCLAGRSAAVGADSIRAIHRVEPANSYADVALPDDASGARRREPRGIRRRASTTRRERAGAISGPSRVADVRRGDGGFDLVMSDGRALRRVVRGRRRRREQPRPARIVRRRFAAISCRSRPGSSRTASPAIEIVIEMFADPPGYIWSFPRPDHLAIGICAQADAGVGVGRCAIDGARSGSQSTAIADGARLEPYAWPIPSLSADDFLSLDLAGPGWLTVGDAAGLVDPITREGIFFALQSAVAAADALSSTSPASRAAVHRIAFAMTSACDLARAARYKQGFFRPRFTRLLVDALQIERAHPWRDGRSGRGHAELSRTRSGGWRERWKSGSRGS